MFIKTKFFDRVRIAPRFLGPEFKNEIRRQLRERVAGKLDFAREVFVVSAKLLEICEGKVDTASGDVFFVVQYEAIVFKPFPGEIYDVVVENFANDNGIKSFVGPLNIFTRIPDGYTFDGGKMISSDPRKSLPEINEGDVIRVRITKINFSMGSMSTTAHLLSKLTK